MAKKKLVVGNWKMYIEKPEDARVFALNLRRKVRGMSGVDIYVAPSLTQLPVVSKVLESSPVKVGAQTISQHSDGKHTGDVSAAMLKGAGASFVIIGHSERRTEGESNTVVRNQLDRAINAGLVPILCIGEEVRGAEDEHFSFVEEELTSALKNVPKNLLKKLIIAYEPVWAIGKRTEDAIKPADLVEMMIFIRKLLADLIDREAALKVPILYGGSVEAENASVLIKEGGVQGLLVGRASTSFDSFLEIIQSVK
jgi:triosephosphate isomerase